MIFCGVSGKVVSIRLQMEVAVWPGYYHEYHQEAEHNDDNQADPGDQS